jgi:hypothetical protein
MWYRSDPLTGWRSLARLALHVFVSLEKRIKVSGVWMVTDARIPRRRSA